jgi:hypothetical protein
MDLKEYTFHVDELGLRTETIEEFIGYDAGKSPELVRVLIKEALEKAKGYCNIKGALTIEKLAVNRSAYSLNINGRELDVKKIIYNQFRKSESIAFFLCTAGEEIGAYAEKLMRQGDLLEGYIMDIVGSEIVEASMDKIQDELEQQLSQQGLKITNRYSPGYCGWSVSEQQKLFSFFPGNCCDITLTSYSLMQPIKSVSGIIGIGHEVSRKGYTCSLCSMANCIYRKKKK